MHRSILILAASFAFANAAIAAGTPQDERDCAKSAKRFCARELPYGDMAVLSCLKQNRPRIARACQAVLVKYGQ